jgi:carboxymethylenebutenolidase
VFTDPAERERLMGMVRGLTNDMLKSDVGAVIGWLASAPEAAGALGAVGYCMGGRPAFYAAAANPRVRAVAALHAGGVITDAEDSPHLSVLRRGLCVYVGVPEIDDHFKAEHEGMLATALHTGGVDHMIEVYAGARHGFTMADLPVYDQPSAERAWRRLETLFAETLKS